MNLFVYLYNRNRVDIMKNKEKDEYKERIDEIDNWVVSSKELQHSPITYFQPKGLYRPMQ